MKPATLLSKLLPYQLSITSNAVSGRIALEYRNRWGLSVPEWRVMAVLSDAGGMTQRDLTRRTLMDKVAVNRACKVLEERELAVRTPNQQDGRSHLLELTDTGRDMHNQIMPLVIDMESRMFAGFSDEQLDQFRSMLDQVRAQADDISEEDISTDNYGVS